MKTISKITIGLVAVAMLMVDCAAEVAKSPASKGASKTITEESLGLRKTDIYTEDSTIADKTEYGTAQATTSTKIKRAFQDAPPMIPHDTTGMLPIKTEDNRCISCHMPEVAGSMGATPIPVSHFTDFRPKGKIVDGKFELPTDVMKNEVAIKQEDKLQNARFNCSACHTPQSKGNLVVENTFEPVFTSKDGANKSSWAGSKMTEALDTVGDESFVTQEDVANKNSPAGTLGDSGH
ncbi:nitrate reductase cytochrome c-type subunit [Sulfurimonas sp.]|uniref:nitrate reductase cytochrome c-type subunit n=1 Tax=Sulfurimonas sp. TaxID=2022749 RepID=UPI0025F9552C|nr:nitrate reductase cytochrome c-type subunit [Sulfurimonas sp.]MBW6488122.1 nitrate reductase cytochrome c-type subunit [Sulfurimonas sp.]